MFPPTLKVTAGQVTETLVTFAVAVPLPVPCATWHVWPGLVGFAKTVTLYIVPVGTRSLKVKAWLPFAALMGSCSRIVPSASCRIKPLPVTPVTVPPIVKASTQETATLVTLAVAVPLPPVTVQVCAGFVGCVWTVTAYDPPLATALANLKVVAAAATVKLSVPLSTNTRPVPVRPEMDPPMVNGPPVPPVPPVLVVLMPLQAARENASAIRKTGEKIFELGFMLFRLLCCCLPWRGRDVNSRWKPPAAIPLVP